MMEVETDAFWESKLMHDGSLVQRWISVQFSANTCNLFLHQYFTFSLRGRSQLSTFMYSYRAYGGGGGHEASVVIFKC